MSREDTSMNLTYVVLTLGPRGPEVVQRLSVTNASEARRARIFAIAHAEAIAESGVAVQVIERHDAIPGMASLVFERVGTEVQ